MLTSAAEIPQGLRQKAGFPGFRGNFSCAFPAEGEVFFVWMDTMQDETRVAVISMIIDNEESAASINALLHDCREYIIGRMGIPYREKGLNIINVVLDAPMDAVSALSGKLGRLPGVTAKAVYSKLPAAETKKGQES